MSHSCFSQCRSRDRDRIGYLIAETDSDLSDFFLYLPREYSLFSFFLSADLFPSAQCNGIYYWRNTREKTCSDLGFSTKPTRFIFRIFTSRFSTKSHLPPPFVWRCWPTISKHVCLPVPSPLEVWEIFWSTVTKYSDYFVCHPRAHYDTSASPPPF